MTKKWVLAPEATQQLSEHVEAIRQKRGRVTADLAVIGGHLIECKRIVGHTYWLAWLDAEFGWSDQTARNFMHLHELGRKSKTVLNLPLPLRDLYRLAAPSTPDEAREAVIAQAEAGKTVTHATITEILPPARPAAKSNKSPTPRNAAVVVKTEKLSADDFINATHKQQAAFLDAIGIEFLLKGMSDEMRELIRERVMEAVH